MEIVGGGGELLADRAVRQADRPVPVARGVEGVGLAVDQPARMLRDHLNVLAARAGIMRDDIGGKGAGHARLHCAQRSGDVGQRGRCGILRWLVAEDARIDSVRVAIGIGLCQNAGANCAEADERAGQRHRQHERQRPDAEPVVPVRARDLRIVAGAQAEGVANDARMGEDTGDRQCRQCDAECADDDHPDDHRQIQILVHPDDEFGPAMRLGRDDLARAVDIPSAIVGGDDGTWQILRWHADIEVRGARLSRLAGDDRLHCGLGGGGREGGGFRDARLLPALPAIVDHDDRAG